MLKKDDIKVIGFDLDNTLYNSNEEMQKKIRGKIYEKLSIILNIHLKESEKLFEENYNGEFPWKNSGRRTIEELGRMFKVPVDGREIVQESIEEAEIIDLIEENKMLEEMLKRLKQKYRLDIITSGNHEFALKKLDKIGIEKKLFELILAEGKFGGKTTGEVYQYWINERKISPNQILYVGDNLRADIEIPKLLGIKTCFVGKENKIADICINDILELEKYL
ncbi:MAG: HAD family hydrolase [Candidatus Pacearchaeota archaeon]|jgi:HAD superfamily hydrolase (TIGR01549 family)